jgi:hypothetical protein
MREVIPKHFPALASLSRWLLSDAWAVTDHSVLLRHCLAELTDKRGELDPRRDDHLAIILEGSVVFSVAFATLVGKVFRQHVQPEQRADLEEAVRVIIWGGRQQYEFFEGLRREYASLRRGEAKLLGLPEWERFLELIRALLDAPRYAFRIPHFIRRLSTGLVSSRIATVIAGERDKTSIHFALKLIEYVCRAASMPTDATHRIRELLIPRITEITELRGNSLNNKAVHQTALFPTEAEGPQPIAPPTAPTTEEDTTDNRSNVANGTARKEENDPFQEE